MKKITQILIFAFCIISLGYADSLISYHEYISPNKAYVVQITNEEKSINLTIKNRKTGGVESSLNNIPLVKTVQWASNSDSFVIVEHFSKFSSATLYCHSKEGWKQYDCTPPLKVNFHGSLVAIDFLKNFVQLSYGIIQEGDSQTGLNLRLCKINVNYNTGNIILDEIKPIKEKDGIKLIEQARQRWEKESQKSLVKSINKN